MRVVVLGAEGFVGSAFVRLLSKQDIDLVPVEAYNYQEYAGTPADVVIEAACNSKKFLADQKPVEEFASSVEHRLRTVHDFPAPFQLHISSVDVYSDLTSPDTTREDSPIDLAASSHYGFHKLLAEQIVQHYAPRWLVIRLAGMVGPNLRKNPVHDILNNQPIRIHPDSQYQFMHTDDVARIVWDLYTRGIHNDIYNVCATGLISPRRIAELAGKSLDLSQVPDDAQPRVVHASNAKIAAYMPMPATDETVAAFVRETKI